MFRWLIVLLLAAGQAARMADAGASGMPPQTVTAQTPASTIPSPPGSSSRAVFDKYCTTCHNQRRQTAGVMLDKMDLNHVGANAETWEKVVRKLRAQEMPPPGVPRPDQGTYRSVTAWLETALDLAAAARPNPGRVAAHRLNRAEYANAIRDLFALEIDSRALLLADDSDEQGFDNIAGVLSVSPALLERYMSAARKISRLVVGDPTIPPVFDTYSVPKGLVQDGRVSEDLPFGSQGGLAVRHYFPMDGEYAVRIRLKRQLYDYILGMGVPHRLEVRLDGQRIKVFTVGGEAPGRPAPATFVGNTQSADAEWEDYLHLADAGLEVRFPATAGTRVVGVSFLDEPSEPEGVLQPPQRGFARATNELYDGKAAVESVAIGGPRNVTRPGETAGRRSLFVCRPAAGVAEEPCAAKILSRIARLAYRRPVTEEDVDTLLNFYKAGRVSGTFDAGIQLALERMLADPNFLFRIERDPENLAPGVPYRLTDLELASRLSFFLWSSIPDDELIDVAARGRLGDPTVLQRQVRRMLADARSRALVDNFAEQWLNLRRLQGAAPDQDVFPDFDENLREAFQQETALFVQSQLREDRSVVDLLSANYTFVNERLARHYGVPGIYGNHFRRVTFRDDTRGGLLGQGSVLTVTSYPNRTSPVLRGKWLLDNLLGAPPPPPPPEVPALQENRANGEILSVRERMQQHRKNPACAVCHVRMDPLGFALENFDALGKWRVTSDGSPIDASAALPDGTQFQGVAGLRKLLVSHREEFVGTFTEKLLTYALGRRVEYFDLPAVRKITREAAPNAYRWSSIILGIANSAPFQMRVVSSPLVEARRSEQ